MPNRNFKKKIMSICRGAAYAEIFRKNYDFLDFLGNFTAIYTKNFRNILFSHFWYMPNNQNVHFKL